MLQHFNAFFVTFKKRLITNLNINLLIRNSIISTCSIFMIILTQIESIQKTIIFQSAIIFFLSLKNRFRESLNDKITLSCLTANLNITR